MVSGLSHTPTAHLLRHSSMYPVPVLLTNRSSSNPPRQSHLSKCARMAVLGHSILIPLLTFFFLSRVNYEWFRTAFIRFLFQGLRFLNVPDTSTVAKYLESSITARRAEKIHNAKKAKKVAKKAAKEKEAVLAPMEAQARNWTTFGDSEQLDQTILRQLGYSADFMGLLLFPAAFLLVRTVYYSFECVTFGTADMSEGNFLMKPLALGALTLPLYTLWQGTIVLRRGWEKKRERCILLFILPFMLSLIILHIPPAYFDIRLDAVLSSLARKFDVFVDQFVSSSNSSGAGVLSGGVLDSVLDAVARASFEENAAVVGNSGGESGDAEVAGWSRWMNDYGYRVISLPSRVLSLLTQKTPSHHVWTDVASQTTFTWKYAHYYTDSPDGAPTKKAWIINSYHMFVRALLASIVGILSVLMYPAAVQTGEWAATILHRPEGAEPELSANSAQQAAAGSAVSPTQANLPWVLCPRKLTPPLRR